MKNIIYDVRVNSMHDNKVSVVIESALFEKSDSGIDELKTTFLSAEEITSLLNDGVKFRQLKSAKLIEGEFNE